MASKIGGQLTLPFPVAAADLPFVIGAANEGTIAVLDLWWKKVADGTHDGPPVLLLRGASGAGKTRLLTRFLDQIHGTLAIPDPGGGIQMPPGSGPIGIDDAHQASAMTLFSVYNECVAARRPLIITGAGRPLTWGTAFGEDLADLKSRLGGVPEATLDPPDEDMLRDALRAALADGPYTAMEDEVEKAAAKLCRRFTAVEAIVSDIFTRGGKPTALKALLQAAMRDNPDHIL